MSINTLNQEEIKKFNRVNVINSIKEHQEITKYQIAKLLKLSIPTVTTNINSLIEEGYVIEAGVANSSGGRKPVILKFNENAGYTFGVNITSEQVEIVLMNIGSKLLEQRQFTCFNEYSFNKVLEKIEEEIMLILEERQILKSLVLGVGFSLPGLVEENQLILYSAPNINVNNFDFKPFEQRIGLKVFIENEANVAAYAETVEGKHGNMSNVVYVSITEGVGTGIIINNCIYKSTHKKAGEFGHMRVSNDKMKCNCGRTGCWELFASKRALFRYFEEETGVKVTSLDRLFLHSQLSDIKVKRAINKYLDHLLIGIENIVLGLNPEYVIIGGELGKYSDKLTEFINEKNQLKNAYMVYENTRIIFSELKDQGALIGAALLPLQQVFFYKNYVI